MYLVEVEFYTWYDMSKPLKAEYIKDNYAVFRVEGHNELQLFVEESQAREEVKGITIYMYDLFAHHVYGLAD